MQRETVILTRMMLVRLRRNWGRTRLGSGYWSGIAQESGCWEDPESDGSCLRLYEIRQAVLEVNNMVVVAVSPPKKMDDPNDIPHDLVPEEHIFVLLVGGFQPSEGHTVYPVLCVCGGHRVQT